MQLNLTQSALALLAQKDYSMIPKKGLLKRMGACVIPAFQASVSWIAKSLDLVKPDPLTSVSALIKYTNSQAAYVSQVTLYTYIKARSGTQHLKLFENEDFLTSLKIARWHIYGACVSDLAMFITARLHAQRCVSHKEACHLARHIISEILSNVSQEDIPPSDFSEMITTGADRIQTVVKWDDYAQGAIAFKTSADAMLRWAPVTDEFKTLDEEIIRNSIHLRWIGTRRDVIEQLDCNAAAQDWKLFQA